MFQLHIIYSCYTFKVSMNITMHNVGPRVLRMELKCFWHFFSLIFELLFKYDNMCIYAMLVSSLYLKYLSIYRKIEERRKNSCSISVLLTYSWSCNVVCHWVNSFNLRFFDASDCVCHIFMAIIKSVKIKYKWKLFFHNNFPD